MYENKWPYDNLPDTKGDICAWLHAVLQKNSRISQELAAPLPLFEPSGTDTSLDEMRSRNSMFLTLEREGVATHRKFMIRSPRSRGGSSIRLEAYR